MRNIFWHMLEGAGSLLDVSGHSKVSESKSRSLRIKPDDVGFYTSAESDYYNIICDGYQALQNSSWLPPEGRKAIKRWLDACQEEPNRFKEYIDKSSSKSKEQLTKTKYAKEK